MTSKYLLPCPCGQKIPVQRRQAGESVECQCGASLRVPTLLGMAELEQVEADDAPERVSVVWGARQQMALLGVVVLLGALVTLATLFATQPPSSDPNLDPTLIRQRSRDTTPLNSLRAWYAFQVEGLDPSQDPRDQEFLEALWKHRLWMGAALAVALVGIGLIAAALAPRKRLPT